MTLRRSLSFALALSLLGLGFAATPAGSAPARIYIANDDHTDYMWAGDEAAYRAAFGQMLDYYMAQAESTASHPSDFRGRFNTDGTLWIREYEATHSPAANRRLWQHVRDGNITVPMNLAVLIYGAMPAEAVIRSMLYAGQLERRENVRLPLVVPMEDQTLPGGIASLWSGCGARYAWKGICDCSSPVHPRDRRHETYHFTGPDGQSVLMKWNSMSGDNRGIGGYAEARNPGSAVETLSQDPGFLDRWPWSVAGAFGYGWDDLETRTHAFIDAAVAQSDATRRVIVSNEVDFFQDLEATHGSEIPRYGAAFGNDWDLDVLSLAEVTGRMKRGVEGLRTAEALAAVATHYDGAVWPSLAAARDSAMLACGLYYEHNFSPGPGVSESQRLAWQRRMENALTSYVAALRSSSGASLAARVTQPAGVERHLVFNALSWTRDDVADLAVSTPEPRHVVDVESGEALPSQTVTLDGVSRLRVRVRGVPSVGYRVVEVRPGAGPAFPPAATVDQGTADNGLVRVTLGARGEITSLVDVASGAELVGPGAALNDIGASAGTGGVTVESSGPVSVTLRVDAGEPLARETRVTLFAGSGRVEVKNEIRQNFTHAVSYESRFDLDGMVMRHEEVGMIARVARQSQGGDYADENTRTDGLTLGHFVDLSRDDRGVTVSAWDSPFFASGASTIDELDATTPSIRVLVGQPVPDIGHGIADQGGDTYFLTRFAFGVHGAYDPAAAMRFSLEHQNPLAAFPVTGRSSSPLPGTTFSALTIESPDVLLWALKPAEEGATHGVIARVWNVADGNREATLEMPGLGLVSARNTTHIETDLGAAALQDSTLAISLARQQMKSFRLFPGGTAGVPPSAPGIAQLSIRPNPIQSANEGLSIAFTQTRPGTARLTIVDVTGARVALLADGASDPGRHEVRWDPRRSDREVKPGIYFVRLETPDGEFGGRIVLLDR